MTITQAQLAEIKKRALAKGISEQEVDSLMPQLVKDFDAQMKGNTIDTSGVKVQSNAKQNTTESQTSSGGFIKDIATSLIQPAVDYGKFVGESVAQPSRAGAEALAGKQGIFGADEIDKQIGQLTRKNREIMAQMKLEKDKTKKQTLATQTKEIDAQIEALGNQAREIGNKQKTFLIDENKIDTKGEIVKTGAKATAGAASYAVPGSLGVGGTALGTVARTAGAGVIAGGLQGYGASDEGNEIGDTLTGAAVGGATAGALSGAGQLLKLVKESRVQSAIGSKLSQAGTEFKKSAYVKAAGRKPIMREGGDKLIDQMMKVGIKPGSPDELIYQADDILIDNAGAIFEKADEFRQKGVTIDKEKVLGPLESKLKTAPAKSKPIIQRVIDFVKQDLDSFNEFTPAEAYAMKGDYGAFGNWNSTMDADAITEANLWEEIYVNLNNLMDSAFKKGGYEDFRKVNELVSTAINTKKYASRAGNVAPNLNTLGLMDVLYGASGMGLTGGVGGAVVGVVLKKAVNSPKSATIIGQTLQKLGQKLGSKTTTTATEAGTNLVGDIATGLATRTAVAGSLLYNSQNLQNNSNNSEDNKSNNSVNKELNQVTPLTDNDATIIPQGSNHPIPKFRQYATRDEMVRAAFDDGLTSEAVNELKTLWDEYAPSDTDSEEIDTLLSRRKSLMDAGFSTATIDKKLSDLGYSPTSDSTATMTDAQKKFGPALSRAFTQMEKISGIGTKDSIFQGGSTSIGKAFGSAKAQARKATDPNFASRIEQYDSQLNLIVGSLSQMMGSGTPQEGEAERLLGSIPDENTSEANAKAWFENVRVVLGVQ